MKILHVITRSDLGGAQTVVINLANAMCANHEVIVVAGENGPMWEALDDQVTKIRIKEIIREVSILKDIKAFFKLKKLYQSIRPDVVHLHSSKIGVLGRLVFPKSITVYSIHGFDSIRIAYRKFLPLEKLLKNRCKAIVLASDYDKNNAINEGITKNLYVVYNGVEEPKLESELKIEKLNNFKKVIMCVARISPQKRFDSFLEIAKMLPKYAFVWIGADKIYQNLPSNVLCLQRSPDAKKFLQLADVFFLPTNYEGVPIVIIDALSYGKPVVASDVGGISEIVVNGINGYAVENDNIIFAEKLKYLLENEEVYKRFCKGSYQIYTQSLTIEEMVKKYLKIYEM